MFNQVNRDKSDTSRFYILTNRLPLNKNYEKNDIRILNISPDTLFIYLGENIAKKIPVVPDIDLSLKKQHFFKGELETIPDSITIRGPRHIVDTIDSLRTETSKIVEVGGNFKKELELKRVSDEVKYEQDFVVVSGNAEQFTEADKLVKVDVINKPDSVNVKLFPPEVKVKYIVGLSDYDLVKRDDFEVTVSYDSIIANKNETVNVELKKHPHFIRNANVDPSFNKVETLIVLKD